MCQVGQAVCSWLWTAASTRAASLEPRSARRPGEPPWPVSAAGCLMAGLHPGLGCGPRGRPIGLRLDECVFPGLWDGPQGRASLGPLSLLWPPRRAVPPRPRPWLAVSAAEAQPSGPLSQSHLCVVPHTAEPAGLFCRCLCPCWPEGCHQVQGPSGETCAASRPGDGAPRTSPWSLAGAPYKVCPGSGTDVFKAGPGRSAALSPVTCKKVQQPQHPPSPRCHLHMGVHSLGPNTAHATSIQHPENVSG